MERRNKHLDTKLIHAGEPKPLIRGAVSMPIFQSSTFAAEGDCGYYNLRYIRLNNTPNHEALHQKLAAVENAEAALVTASGMAAISTTLFTLLRSGDHLLAQDCLYGGTHDFISEDLPACGISVDFIDGTAPDSWESKIRSNTRAIFVETLTNPLLQMADLKGVAEFARQKGIVSLIDNTFASPVNFRPAEWGFDLSLHSGTKYLNGHSDIVAGAVIGPSALLDPICRKLARLGGSLDPHACFLLHRGMKTLGVRVRYQNESALKLAQFLENHPAVDRVHYPGLESHPGHTLAEEMLDGFGGMISFEVTGGVEAADRILENVTLPISAPSLGGVESLITRPATTSHAGVPPEQRRVMGISDSLIRLSVGLEATEDLMADFDQALT
ncbi:MAG: aminotransferase class I/II-fold pyridoxal phosphate-dependent enzyme [Deltaproteobacteria bacterium]|nr:aminotransferase class I/II-fold pyridoxal phosphate-dependent enzyme [Deltaproteobacteria bacterium]